MDDGDKKDRRLEVVKMREKEVRDRRSAVGGLRIMALGLGIKELRDLGIRTKLIED
jgi:hypothetical protein